MTTNAEPTKPVPVASEHPVVAALIKEGVSKDCLARADQVAKFLTGDGDTGAFVFIPKNEKGRNGFSVSFEIMAKDVLSYATASFAPDGAGNCHAHYETVTYWLRSCDETWKTVIPQARPENKIRSAIHVMGGIGDNARIFLVPVGGGAGCIAIKKEMLYAVDKPLPESAVSSSGKPPVKKK